MIIIIGLIILVAALVVGVAGVLGNGGSAHVLTHFSVLGYHVTGPAGTLFLDGIVVGAAGLLGLGLLLAGARRTSRRGGTARQKLRQSRRETAAVSRDRDDLVEQRRIARSETASTPENGALHGDHDLSPADGRQGRPHLLGHRSARRQAATTQPEWPNSQPGSGVSAEAPVSVE